ncbi:MAG: O-succinylhomoserine sulfhydrylase [Pseudomonadota bacterium]|nr:O-succinylhomoserine sulfhydrylase [Pseudomonadota bacterium]
MKKDAKFSTKAIRVGQLPTDENSHSEPLFLTSSFVFDSAEQAAAIFAGEEKGNVYSRFTNPTVRSFEQRLAALEGAERSVAFASGMAAIQATIMSLLNSGDHIVAAKQLFGSIPSLINNYFIKFGIEVTYVDVSDVSAWQAAIQDNTRLFFLETPSNPLCEIADVAAIASISKANDILLVVDNCFATPYLQKPLAQGADIIIHSATKYLDGQGRCVGGAVCGSNELMEELFKYVRTAGSCMSPFNAWVCLKGLETLHLRIQAHCASAMRVALWLSEQPQVGKVNYSGLPTHPQHQLAASQMNNHFGGILSFELAEGGNDEVFKIINSIQLLSRTANLGDAKTTITHPATTTHARVGAEVRKTMGISDRLIRLSVGLEDTQDIIEDLQQAFNQLG